MHLFKFFNLLLSTIIWNKIEIEIPVYENIGQHIIKVEANLYEDGVKINDPDMYYVYNAVENTFLSDINTNYIGTMKHWVKVVFPNYYMESKQEITIKIVDKIKPTITNIPTFDILLNQKLPDLTLGLQYYDNYDEIENISVLVLGSDVINNKKVGSYLITYQVIDSSKNVSTAQTYVNVLDIIPPEINKLKEVVIEMGEPFQILNYYKITDNHDTYINTVFNDSLVNYNKLGIYPITLIATDQSGNQSIKNDFLEIVYTKKPEIEFYNLDKIEVYNYDYYQLLVNNIKFVNDKVDILTINDVIIEDGIDITKVGTYDVLYKLTNSQNNTVEKIIKIKVVDETKPTISIINDLVLDVYLPDIIFSEYFLIYDNYTLYSDLTIKYTHSIKKDVLGKYSLKIEVTDKDKNTEVLETTFEVVDRIPPSFIDFPNELYIEVFQSIDLRNYKISDNYDKNPTISPHFITLNEVGRYEIILYATDSSGNENSHIISFIVEDLEEPLIILSTNEVKLGVDSKALNLEDFIVDVYDNYDQLNIKDIKIIDDINYHKMGIYEVIYFVKDNSNNETYKILKVVIDDTRKPRIITKNIEIKMGQLFDIFDNVVVEDSDEYIEIDYYPKNVNFNKTGTYKIVYTAIDSRGNIATSTREIKVIDNKTNYITPILIGGNLIITFGATFFIYQFIKKKRQF